MSRFKGRQDFTGPKNKRKNKGVLRAYRGVKREEAQARQASADPRNSKAWQRGSKYDPATGKRVSFKKADWDHYRGLIDAYLAKNPELADAQA